MPPYNPKVRQQQIALAQKYSPSYAPPKPSWEQQYDANKRVIATNSQAQIRGKQTAAQTTKNLRKAGIQNMQGNTGGPGLITGSMLDTAGSWAGIGIKPSIIGKALWAGIHHPLRTMNKGYAPGTPMPTPVWGGRVEQDILGHSYVLRPVGKGNTLKDKLHILDAARGEAKNFMGNEAHLPRNQQRASLVKYYDQHKFLDNLHNQVKAVDVNGIMKKQPWEMTRAEIVAHPYTVFHNSRSRPGLGPIEKGIHTGTLQAANDRVSLHSPGTNIHPVWMFPKDRNAIGEAAPNDEIFNQSGPDPRPAPGAPMHVVRDSGEGTPASGAIRSAWEEHFQGFPLDRQPPRTYHDNPAAVKGFFDRLKDIHIPTKGITSQDKMIADTQNTVKKFDLFPYENNAEHPGSISYEAHDPQVMKTHKQMIVEAALQGHKIPPRVLRDYPGLQRQIARYQKQGYAGNLLRDVYRKNPVAAISRRPGEFMGPANKLVDFQRQAGKIDDALARTEARHSGKATVSDYTDYSIPQGQPDIFADLNLDGPPKHNVGVNPFADDSLKMNQTPTNLHTDDLHFWYHNLNGSDPGDADLALETSKGLQLNGHDNTLEDEAKKWMGMPRNVWENLTPTMRVKHIRAFLKTKLAEHGIEADAPYNVHMLQK